MRLRGRASVTVAITIVALAIGAVGGYAVSMRRGASTASGGPMAAAGSGDAADTEQWYTCGMHPNVLQKGPGDCPICQMKLTPLKKESEDGGDTGGGERKVLYWRAPMDPNYISEKPGKSPMGMDLVPVYADAEESSSTHTIRIDPVTIQNMGIRTAAVKRAPLIKTIRTVGRVDYDEQLVTFVDTKFEGWIENLYVDETGQKVDKGQRLFDVYSPELYAAQQEYLSAIQNLPRMEKSTISSAREDARKMVEASVIKLKYLDVSDEQIEALRKTLTIEKTLTIHSPASGIVTDKMALEGMNVKPGMRLYTIADLSRVWVYVDVYEYQLPWVGVGQRAYMTLPYVPGKDFVGKVVYVYPYLEERTRVIKVRLEFENPGLRLKPGMYANVRLESELQRDALLVRREAYIDSGTRKVAFVDRGDGKFTPRDIQVGVEAEDGMVEVLYGLDEGEVVVTSGQFMLDAESKLKEAVAKMMEAERAKTTKRGPPSGGEMGGEHGEMAMGGAMTMPPDTAYACPMETHPDENNPDDKGPYFSAEPGKCPRCGMKLKPIDKFSWAEKYKPGAAASAGKTAEAHRGIPEDAKYACPMDAHPDQDDPAEQGPYFSSEQGKCPRCGMKVKPLDELDWVRVLRAAQGGDAAYTCPDHQLVFSERPGECPRCGRTLAPFKVMYTCPDPDHAGNVSSVPGNCPLCGRGMAAFRGIWLDEDMASGNVPPSPGMAEAAAYHCRMHPLVHSDNPGACTICGAPLVASHEQESETPAGQTERGVPADAKFVCSMEECWYFSGEEGECPKCGMKLRPIRKVRWAKEALAAQQKEQAPALFVCPMHSDRVREKTAGTCPVCGMRLVAESALKRPVAAPEQIATQMDYIMEHYLELQRRLASDRTSELGLHALGLASAAEELAKHMEDPGINLSAEAVAAVKNLRVAAMKITGKLSSDRVTFVELSAAVRTLVEHARPDRTRWPRLYIYHCPMSKGDWLQPVKEKANPYYGFKMLDCGELKAVE